MYFCLRHSAAERTSNASVALARLREKTREGLRLASCAEPKEERIVSRERIEEIEEIRKEGFASKSFYSSRSKKESLSCRSNREDLPSVRHTVRQPSSVLCVDPIERNEDLQDIKLPETNDTANLLPDTQIVCALADRKCGLENDTVEGNLSPRKRRGTGKDD
ncbi:hypothetical protein D918_01074 [Trichuris suis]|nr:hypothetical protein D918_01074 [Trichuris suis]